MEERGKRVYDFTGYNVCTLTGREYLAERITLNALSPRAERRSDCIAYIGMGQGAQPEVSSVSRLVDPVAYATGLFLAPLDAPPNFPVVASGARTAVEFSRTYGYSEISIGAPVVLTEMGLFTDGNPEDDWSVESLDRSTSQFARAPMFYKVIDPVTKTTGRTLKILWEVRIA